MIGIVLNPTAGKGRAGRIFPEILTMMHEEGIKPLVEITERPKHAYELTRKLLDKGVEVVISAGGDGTINEVVNVLAERDFPVPMGALAIGTGNDLLRTAGTAKDFRKQIKVIKEGNVKHLDIMDIEYTDFEGNTKHIYSLNDFDVGFPAKIGFRVNNATGWYKGPLSYAIAAVRELNLNKPVDLTIETPDYKTSGKFSMVFCVIGKYLGGGIYIAPMAEVDDGLLDILFIGQTGRLETVNLLVKAFQGKHLPNPKIKHIRTQEVHIHGTEELIVAQGEILGYTPAKVRLLPRKVPFLWPK
ncbi:diacylglycerol kinase family lipid kinase [Coprothermobacteraceae bacterium]|nr:diacylglycerol kinase family lipid kinase [Coprothermobacteraceae bacterium]